VLARDGVGGLMHRSKDTAANTLPNLIFRYRQGGPLGAEAAKRVQTHLGSVDAAEIVLEAERSTPRNRHHIVKRIA
jgi:hypothetical protein